MIFLIVGVGAVGIHTAKSIEERLKDTVERDVKPSYILGEMERKVGFIRATTFSHLLAKSELQMRSYESDIDGWESEIDNFLDSLERSFTTQVKLKKLAEFRVAWMKYSRLRDQKLLPLSQVNRKDEALALASESGAVGIAERDAFNRLEELNITIVDAANFRLALASQTSASSESILVSTTLVAILLGLLFGLYQSSQIASAVNAVSKTAQLVATGDFEQSVTVRTGDEIESMANSFNTMTAKMKKMVLAERETARQLRDEIDERKLIEAVLKVKNEELQAFTYTVSHDLKSPLWGIDGYAEELHKQHSNELDERARFCLDQIMVASKNLENLIEDILQYSRLSEEKLSLADVKPQEIISAILDGRSRIIDERGIKFSVDISFSTIYTWQRGLTQVLANLIDNAIKYSRCTKYPYILITGRELPDAYQFSVADNGIGFDMRYHDRLFELFHRLVRQEEFEGTGAGLAIAKKVLDRQGGRIWAESQPGAGAHFFIELPKL
ncbi:MCP four helix bundle domain-containing protein [Leptolyngbya sp. FACHB-261]|nr:MCP four helix bundle domain-containing protein [Leptolyngbya sp. FACHB-261]